MLKLMRGNLICLKDTLKKLSFSQWDEDGREVVGSNGGEGEKVW